MLLRMFSWSFNTNLRAILDCGSILASSDLIQIKWVNFITHGAKQTPNLKLPAKNYYYFAGRPVKFRNQKILFLLGVFMNIIEKKQRVEEI